MLERMWSKGNTHSLLVGMQTSTTTLEISMVVSQKIGNQPTSRLSKLLVGINPKDTQSFYKDICSTMFIVALLVIISTWKQPRCPLTREWINKMWYIYTMEYYSLVKNNDILKIASTWMEL